VETLGLTKTYRMNGSEISVLRGVDLTIYAGETIAIVGPSGAGKSTLLHLLGLLDQPTGGTYRFDGEEIGSLGENQKAQLRLKGIGFIFQFHHLLSEFSALENVMLPALMLGVTREVAEASAVELLREVGLESRASHKPGELSGGEQQRVALARALVNRPRLILADEPTGNLDSEAAFKMKEILWQVCSENGAAVVLVTHNLALASEAGTVLTMESGKLMHGTAAA